MSGMPEQFERNHAAIHEAPAGACAVCDKVRAAERWQRDRAELLARNGTGSGVDWGAHEEICMADEEPEVDDDGND